MNVNISFWSDNTTIYKPKSVFDRGHVDLTVQYVMNAPFFWKWNYNILQQLFIVTNLNHTCAKIILSNEPVHVPHLCSLQFILMELRWPRWWEVRVFVLLWQNCPELVSLSWGAWPDICSDCTLGILITSVLKVAITKKHPSGGMKASE